MTPTMVICAVGLLMVPITAGTGLLFLRMRADQRLQARVAELHRSARGAPAPEADPGRNVGVMLIGLVFYIGDWALRCGLLSERTRGDLETTLRSAGHSSKASLRQFIGAKVMLLVALPVGAWFVTGGLEFDFFPRIISIIAGAVAGSLLPDMVVRQLRGRYTKRIEEELPDALDMMVICAQAGLGLATAIVRVANELQFSHRAVALELAYTANELQVVTDVKIPLINLGNRCGVSSAKRLAATLLQSAQYGTPLSEALRGLAAELRVESITRFEARAARMPVLLTMPMIAFILPTLFMVVGGPAAISVVHAFKG